MALSFLDNVVESMVRGPDMNHQCFECGYRFPSDYVSECSYCWEIICDECLGEHMTFHDMEDRDD